MEKRIALEKRGLPDDQTRELILDNCRSTHIEGLTDSFTALEILSLINVGLVSLKSFPKLPALRKLELSDNRILNGLNHLVDSPQLTHLNLSGNRIKDFEELTPLKELKNLEVLDLFNNEVTSTDNYRDKIFALIPSLKYLDGFDKDDTEAPSDEDEDANGYDDDEDSDNLLDEEETGLSEVYNDDLVDDDEDWDDEEDEEDYADDPTDDEEDDGEEAEEGAVEVTSDGDGEVKDAEAARGTKRKHDGNDG
ncbi:acidic leucine-rich nuclear phosphoprotein 32 family member A isoform X2 [Uranotaenia lowii]|uniref:acidic leucine-rich nuclear phosphoprotein 32 family member A isoform X2 n=1 Tax=Uranotaenia lowii TaxID=190385 RepID=UPI0024787014|nr:acidic leucine-rich nuclear phosphoprotein 32 family member A isoform X2 [Uranotaenia lowii]